MTRERPTEQRIADWLASEAPTELPDWVLGDTFANTRSTAQLSRVPGWRTFTVDRKPLALAAGAVAIAIIAIGGAVLITRPTSSVGEAPSTAPSTAPSPAASVAIPIYQTPLGSALVGLDGTIIQELSLPPGAWAPALSPDGRRVAFVLSDRLALKDVGSSGPPSVMEDVFAYSTSQIAWSPDGTRIALTVGGRLHVIDPSTSEDRDLPTSASSAGWPAWSADGQWIYYVDRGSQPPDDSGFSPTQEIWRVPAAGGSAERLTDNEDADLQPDVRRDGTVAFFRNDEIWTMDADGGNQGRLASVTDIGFNPRWSPDGTQLALIQYDPSMRTNLDPTIYRDASLPLLKVIVVDVASGALTEVGPRVASFDNPVSWTPDGQALLINRYDDGG